MEYLNVSSLVKKKKRITTQKLVKLKIELLLTNFMINILLIKNLINSHQKIFTARLKQANLASKNDIANFVERQILIIN